MGESIMTVKIGKKQSFNSALKSIHLRMNEIQRIFGPQEFRLLEVRLNGRFVFFNYQHTDLVYD